MLPESKGLPAGEGKSARFAMRSFSVPRRNGGDFFMEENRLAIISVLVYDREQSPAVNAVLSQYGERIIGRMGIPYRERGVNVMCIVIDAPNEIINTVTGKLGMIKGVTAKTLTSKA